MDNIAISENKSNKNSSSKSGYDWKESGRFFDSARNPGPETKGNGQEKNAGKNQKTGKSQSNEIVVYPYQRYVTEVLPQKEFLLAPILENRSINLLFAERGVGKTWFAMTLAHAVACGLPAFGIWRPERAFRVCYWDGEMASIDMQGRLLAIEKMFNARPSEGFYNIVSYDLQERALPNLADPKGQVEAELIMETAELVIIDNISCLIRTKDSNNADAWQPVQQWLLSLRRKGKTLLLLHHAGKNKTSRGSSALEDNPSAIFELRRPQDYDESEGSRFEVVVRKGRNITGLDAERKELWLRDGTWQVKSLDLCLEDQIPPLIDEGLSLGQIAKELGTTKRKIQTLCNKNGWKTAKAKKRGG